MLVIDTVRFTPHAFEENYRKLLSWAFIADESASDEEIKEVEGEVAKCIERFTIISKYGVSEVVVGPGTYRTALLLYYMALHRHCDGFDLHEEDIKHIREYYSEEIIRDAVCNPCTLHTNVRALVSTGGVHVSVKRL